VPNSTQLLKEHYKFILFIKTNWRHLFVGDSVLSACRNRYVACMGVEIAMTDLREARINTRSISLHLNFVICTPSHLIALNTFASFIFVPCTSYLLLSQLLTLSFATSSSNSSLASYAFSSNVAFCLDALVFLGGYFILLSYPELHSRVSISPLILILIICLYPLSCMSSFFRNFLYFRLSRSLSIIFPFFMSPVSPSSSKSASVWSLGCGRAASNVFTAWSHSEIVLGAVPEHHCTLLDVRNPHQF